MGKGDIVKDVGQEQEEKYLAELRFYNFLRRMPRRKRSDYYLVTLLKFDDCRAGQLMCFIECITATMISGMQYALPYAFMVRLP